MTLNFSPLAPFRLSVWSLFNDIAEDRGGEYTREGKRRVD